MAKNNDTLKKYHFWILFGLVPLLVLIAVVTVTSSVGGAINKRVADFKASEDEISKKTNPKPKALIDELDKANSKVASRKGELWKLNWEGDPARGFKGQKDMYTWPNSPLLKEIERKNLKFGDRIPNNQDQYEEFKKPEVYLAEFSTEAKGIDKRKLAPGAKGMVEMIAPTQFGGTGGTGGGFAGGGFAGITGGTGTGAGGWQSILRYVNAWDDRLLTSEQIWLMMEDIWVQRSMLDAVRAVNAQMAEFERVKFEKDGVVIDDPKDKNRDDPLRRKFKSRIWEVELEVVNKDNRKVLTGRLINHTDRLQLMGLNNTMILKVWFEKDTDERGRPRPNVQPFEFKIGGEFLPGKGAVREKDGKPANVVEILEPPNLTADHILPVTMTVDKIYKVEQVFDARTVPVRRIEAMALGFQDSRSAAVPLQIPKFPVFVKEQETLAAGATGPDGSPIPGGMGPGGSTDRPLPGGPGGFGTPGGPGGMAGQGQGQGQGNGKWGGGTVDVVINGNKKRYVDVTDNVRRMPLGISIVIDQAYMQDALMAFANSPLRFQITQANWARFRGQLAGIGAGTGGPFSSGGGDVISGPGNYGSGFDRRFGSDPDAGPSRVGPGTGGPGPVRPLAPGGGMGSPMGIGPMGVGPLGPGGGTPGDPYGYGSPSTVSDSQLTSGLIQLDIYGVVSLYEKYTPPGEATPTDASAKEPAKEPVKESKDKEPVKEPKENGKESKEPKDSKEPMMPETKTPKMRRRNRRA